MKEWIIGKTKEKIIPHFTQITENNCFKILNYTTININFIKPKTYSAPLPPDLYDSPYLWNVFTRVTKHLLQSIFSYYEAWHIALASRVD